MPELYPLRFKPIYKQYVWGGWKLAGLLKRPIPHDELFAESWEVCDHGEDQSVVDGGSLSGMTLHELVEKYGRRLLGDVACGNRFPLLMKYLDATQNLSVQVHPDDDMAARLDPPDLGKTEAWYVLAAVPGSVIYAGLRQGVDLATFARAIKQGECEECLHYFEAQRGDCILIPSGTVHALGAGILVAEIQQSSDTTFRLFDWNRLGTDGRPRELHIEQGLAAIDFERGPISPIRHPVNHEDDSVNLISSDKFSLERHPLMSPRELGGDGRFHILTVVDGSVSIEGAHGSGNLNCGQTMLLPAQIPAVRCIPCPDAVVLDVFVES
ncbi:MAG: class I mannose-6-phosphate isomerase [Pirellulales bacterium]|nr:class I mannose-6-phosphate isomerase [Pirellulales bacterium]